MREKHLEHRGSRFFGAWNELLKQHKCMQFSFKVNAKLFQKILAPTLLHGVISYALTCDDILYLQKLQNSVQRKFLNVPWSDAASMWRELHSKLRGLRESGKLPDVVQIWRAKLLKQRWDARATEVLMYRGKTWQRTWCRSKPRRTSGRPPTTLTQTIERIKDNHTMAAPSLR